MRRLQTPNSSESSSTDQEIGKARLNHYKHSENSEIDCAARIKRNPEQRHDQLTEVGAHSRVFYIEFAVVKNFLQVRKLIPTLADLGAQLLLFRIWRNILCCSLQLSNKTDLREASVRQVSPCLHSSEIQ